MSKFARCWACLAAKRRPVSRALCVSSIRPLSPAVRSSRRRKANPCGCGWMRSTGRAMRRSFASPLSSRVRLGERLLEVRVQRLLSQFGAALGNLGRALSVVGHLLLNGIDELAGPWGRRLFEKRDRPVAQRVKDLLTISLNRLLGRRRQVEHSGVGRLLRLLALNQCVEDAVDGRVSRRRLVERARFQVTELDVQLPNRIAELAEQKGLLRGRFLTHRAVLPG